MNAEKQQIRKEQILHAAMQVLVKKGYENSRIDDIVKESGMSKGAIYWYYQSKKVVYLDLVDYWVQRYSATLNHIVEGERTATDELKDLFQFFVSQYESDPVVFKALVEFWSLAGRDDDFKDKLQSVYSEFLHLIKKILELGKKTGEFKNIDITATALSIMINIEGIIWFTLFDVNHLSPRKYIQTITDFILAGLQKKSKK